jgi:predicted metal-dependent HD superfamily phosphohydrolase
VFGELCARYAEPHRRYHNLEHIAACLAILDGVRERADDAWVVEGALWFHDAIYRLGDAANERRSAELARERLAGLGCGAERAHAVAQLVMATDHRTPPDTSDGKLTADIDLAILGQPEGLYDRYAAAIRAEAALPEDEFGRRRAEFLCGMLAKAALFHTALFLGRYEAAARANMRRELNLLRADLPKSPSG